MSAPQHSHTYGGVSSIQTAQSCPSMIGIEPTIHISQHTTEPVH